MRMQAVEELGRALHAATNDFPLDRALQCADAAWLAAERLARGKRFSAVDLQAAMECVVRDYMPVLPLPLIVDRAQACAAVVAKHHPGTASAGESPPPRCTGWRDDDDAASATAWRGKKRARR